MVEWSLSYLVVTCLGGYVKWVVGECVGYMCVVVYAPVLCTPCMCVVVYPHMCRVVLQVCVYVTVCDARCEAMRYVAFAALSLTPLI